MKYDDETLSRIYDRTSGYCHICGKKLSFKNYADFGRKSAWEVEHSNPQAKGGTSHGNNLFPAHISCNRSKGTVPSRTARAQYGRKRAPLSKGKRKEAKAQNAIAGGVIGGLIGTIFGPVGAVAGATIGAIVGHDANPDKEA